MFVEWKEERVTLQGAAPFSVLGSWTAGKGNLWLSASFCQSLLPECVLTQPAASRFYRENCSATMN